MSADLLIGLARGDGAALLQTVRLTVGQGELYGAEDVAAYFRANPAELEGGTLVTTARHVALLGADVALVADVYDNYVARLWLVGPPSAEAPEPHVDVPFHLGMSQVPSHGMLGRAEDHPFYAAAGWPAVEQAAARLASDVLQAEAARAVRPIALRVFGDAQRGCGLFAVHVQSGGGERGMNVAHAALLIEHGEASRVIRDPALAARPWRPRIQA